MSYSSALCLDIADVITFNGSEKELPTEGTCLDTQLGSSMNEPHLQRFQSSLYKIETQAPVATSTTGMLMVQTVN